MNPFIANQKDPSAQKESSAQKEPSASNKKPSAEQILTNILEQEQLCLEQVIQLLKTENKAIIERAATAVRGA